MSEIVWLEPEERAKFILWLEQDVASTEGIIEQMQKLPSSNNPAMQELIKRKRAEVLAQHIVIGMLRNCES